MSAKVIRVRALVAAPLLAALVLSGCAGGAGTTGPAVTQAATPPAVTQAATPRAVTHAAAPPAAPPAVTQPAAPARATPRHQRRRHRRRPAPPQGEDSLADSTASNDVVQPQPASGSCHAIGAGPDSRPDPTCTPGALDPAVMQGNIDRTICADGWTETVCPPETITEPEKAASMAAYGDTGSLDQYEYDHLVPLELGGATNDPRNLWPEPAASPNPKDAVEDELRQEVCDGQMTLARAQRAIVTNWTTAAGHGSPNAPTASATSPAASPTSPIAGATHCTATASYDSKYNDYDVYVRSNQPDQVGSARCSTTL